MIHTCQQCKRTFEYTDTKGYSKEFCGPICDGSNSGRNTVIQAMRNLATQLRTKADENEGTDAELAFEASASSIERICDELTTN